MSHLLAASTPPHGTLGVLFGIALVLFVIAAVMAYFVPTALHRAAAAAFVGLAVCALAWAWIEFAAA